MGSSAARGRGPVTRHRGSHITATSKLRSAKRLRIATGTIEDIDALSRTAFCGSAHRIAAGRRARVQLACHAATKAARPARHQARAGRPNCARTGAERGAAGGSKRNEVVIKLQHILTINGGDNAHTGGVLNRIGAGTEFGNPTNSGRKEQREDKTARVLVERDDLVSCTARFV